jgi:hypothetical protein
MTPETQVETDTPDGFVTYDELKGPDLDAARWSPARLPLSTGEVHIALDPNAELAVGDGEVRVTVPYFSLSDDRFQAADSARYLILSTRQFELRDHSATFAADLAVTNIGGEPGDYRWAMAAFQVFDLEVSQRMFSVCGTSSRVFALDEQLRASEVGEPFIYMVESPYEDFDDDFTSLRACEITLDRSRSSATILNWTGEPPCSHRSRQLRRRRLADRHRSGGTGLLSLDCSARRSWSSPAPIARPSSSVFLPHLSAISRRQALGVKWVSWAAIPVASALVVVGALIGIEPWFVLGGLAIALVIVGLVARASRTALAAQSLALVAHGGIAADRARTFTCCRCRSRIPDSDGACRLGCHSLPARCCGISVACRGLHRVRCATWSGRHLSAGRRGLRGEQQLRSH